MANPKLQKLLQVINRISFRGFESLALILLSTKSRCYTLKKESSFTHLHNPYQIFKEFCDDHNYVAKKHPIIGWVTDNEEDLLATQMLLDEVSKQITCKTSFNWAIAEILCKVLAYRDLKEKDEFILPYYFKASHKETIAYEVNHIFDLWKSMRAFGLRSKKPGYPSILLFRGTDFSMLSNSSRFSILSNFDPNGPGHTIYSHAREEITAWLKQEAETKTLPIVLGYSLGGALASFALLNDPSLFSKEHFSYIFNHPGFSEENLQKWNDLPKEKRPKCLSFVTDGDLVSKFGLLFEETLGTQLKKTMPPIRAHTDLQLIQTSVKIKPVDLQKENCSTSRRIYSKLHKNAGRFFFNIGLKLFFPYN